MIARAAVDIESLFIALLVVAVLALGYRLLRHRAAAKGSAPEHFFGGVGEETVMAETRGSPSELPSPREHQPSAGQRRS